MSKSKKIYVFSMIAFWVANLLSVLSLLFISYKVSNPAEVFVYVRIFVTKFIDFAIPAVAALLLFLDRDAGVKKLLGSAILLALPRLAYSIPYYYFYFLGSRYDSRESITMSFFVSAFGVALVFGQIMLIYLVMKKMSSREGCLEIKSPFDFSSVVTLGIFSGVFLQFIIGIIGEIISTVDFIISYGGFLKIGEIIYVCICYLFVLCEMLLVHLLCHMLYKKGYDDDEEEEDKEDEGDL